MAEYRYHNGHIECRAAVYLPWYRSAFDEKVSLQELWVIERSPICAEVAGPYRQKCKAVGLLPTDDPHGR